MKLAAAAYPLTWFDHFDDFAAHLGRWVADAAGQGANLLTFPEYGSMELTSLGGRLRQGLKPDCMRWHAGSLPSTPCMWNWQRGTASTSLAHQRRSLKARAR